MSLSCKYISANCNPMSNTIQFVNPETIAFCFRNQVGLYSLTNNKIISNLNYRVHDINRANCLSCLNGRIVIVGYDSGHLIVFTQTQGNVWKHEQVIKQEHAITLIEIQGKTLITNNTNAQIIFYDVQNDNKVDLKETERLRFPLNKIMESVIQIAHEDRKIVMIGGTDQKLYCYSKTIKQQKLAFKFELSGHENAITKLAVTQQNDDYLIASSSKDGYIRIWRLTQNSQVTKFHKNVKSFDNKFYCFLDAVLISHECSVTDLKWVRFNNVLQLASCSLDCTICLWGYESEGGAWAVDSRMGQFLGNKNAYFCIVTDPEFKYLVAINYIGSAMIWQYNQESKKFTLRPSFNGHTNQVKDIDWNHTGDFLVSVSKDQTTRIVSKNCTDNLYHEISRAQVHGYDINAVATIKVNEGIVDLIACGADQKVIRIIEPPACFANYLNYTTKANLHLFFPNPEEEKKFIVKNEPILEYQTYAEGGTQVLGLMTKMQRVERQKITAYYDDEEGGEQQEQNENMQESKQTKIDFTIPPHDDYLVKHTLWPEMNKLYGHPHQIAALAKSQNRKLLASSCQGKNKTFCTIIIWDTQTWKISKMIQHHQYVVNGMDFSKCGEYFTSVSKDRKLAVFNKQFDQIFSLQAHSRAITSVCFSENSQYIVTGSRDKTVKIHSVTQHKTISQFDLKQQAHAVAFCLENVVAVGCQDGSILLLQLLDNTLKEIFRVDDKFSHTKTVNKLRYKNGLLASCADDHSVRIFELTDKQKQN